MLEQQQLAWVHANRRRFDRVRHLGGIMRSLVAPALGAGERQAEVASAFDRIVDDEFRAHCRIGPMAAGRLVILVDHPTILYAMRVRWQQRLLDALSATMRSRGPRSIVFEYGVAGLPVGAANTEASAHADRVRVLKGRLPAGGDG